MHSNLRDESGQVDCSVPIHDFELRQELCTESNTKILERVGELITLPHTGWTTRKMVAKFFEVKESMIKQLISRYKQEFQESGYQVVSTKKLPPSPEISLKARKIAIFPRQSVLRIAMFLQNSSIAEEIRSYLLQTEKSLVLQDDDTVLTMISSQADMISSMARELANTQERVKNIENIIREDHHRINELEKRVPKRISMVTEEIINPTPQLSARRAQMLRNLAKKKGKNPAGVRKIWKLFKDKFDVDRYVLLPDDKFPQALEWMENLT